MKKPFCQSNCIFISENSGKFGMSNFDLLKIDVDVGRCALLRSIFDEHANQCCWIIHIEITLCAPNRTQFSSVCQVVQLFTDNLSVGFDSNNINSKNFVFFYAPQKKTYERNAFLSLDSNRWQFKNKNNKITTISHGIVHNEINKYWSIVACCQIYRLTQLCGRMWQLFKIVYFERSAIRLFISFLGHFFRCYLMSWTFTAVYRCTN